MGKNKTYLKTHRHEKVKTLVRPSFGRNKNIFGRIDEKERKQKYRLIYRWINRQIGGQME
jgi:hypothetical protein